MAESDSDPLHEEEQPAAPAEWPFFRALTTFLDAMEAARELSLFISEHADQLSDVEKAFAAEARRRYPLDPDEQHEAAAKLVHRAVHQRMDIREKLESEGADPRDIEQATKPPMDALRNDLEELTGGTEFFGQYGLVWTRIATRRPPASILRGSLLISIVSDFEVLVASIVAAILESRPEILRAHDARYSLKELEAFANFEELRTHVAEKMADGLLRGGFDDWMSWFGERHHIEVPGVTDSPAELVEIFQRRHLLVHAGGVVNSYYLSRVEGSKDSPEIGDTLSVNRTYLLEAVDRLSIAAIKLTSGTALKFVPDEQRVHVGHRLGHVVYDLLKAGEFAVVAEVNAWTLEWITGEATQIETRVNQWVAKKGLHGPEAIKDEVSAWDVETRAGIYKLVRLALLDENESARDLAIKLIASEELTEYQFRTWPVFSGLRAYVAKLAGSESGDQAWLFVSPHAHET